MILRIFIYINLIATLSGCAVSGLSQKQIISMSQLSEDKESKNITLVKGVLFQCSEYPVSMMIFPLVPLPPIIPMSWAADNKVRIHVNPKNIDSYLISIKIENKKYNILESYDIPKEDKVSLNLGFPKDCSMLDNSKIILTEQNKSTGVIKSFDYILKYEKSKLEFNWGYLSA